MSTNYPYTSISVCENCQGPIIIKQKRDIVNQFCSKECYNQHRKTEPTKVKFTSKFICLKCGEEFSPGRNTKGMYCSYACSNGAKSVRYKIICECCGKEFEINNIAEIKRGHYKYCSNECRKRKYHIKEDFFDVVNENTCYWLGFIWSSIRNNSYNKISLLSKKELLERFSQELDSSYPIKKSISDKYVIQITSLKLLNKLVEFGIKDELYLEFPNIPLSYYKDFIRGYFDSTNGYHYKDRGNDIVSLHGKSSKLMIPMSDFLKSRIVMNKGEWVSISFNFYKIINGLPKLEEKWNKFNEYDGKAL